MRHDIDKNRSESIRQGSILTVQRIIESLLIIQNCSCISVQTCLSKIVTNDEFRRIFSIKINRLILNGNANRDVTLPPIDNFDTSLDGILFKIKKKEGNFNDKYLVPIACCRNNAISSNKTFNNLFTVSYDHGEKISK